MRVRDDFSEFLQRDQVQVYDIMSVPSLTPYELNQKLIFIVKKEDDNLDRLLKAFETDFPVLQQKKVLIVDDEADLASVSFRKGKDGTAMPGVISQQIDRLREISKGLRLPAGDGDTILSVFAAGRGCDRIGSTALQAAPPRFHCGAPNAWSLRRRRLLLREEHRR